jgi:hypothetical protein
VHGDVATVGRWKPIPLLVWTTGWKAYSTAGLDDRLEAYPTCESVTIHHANDRLR